MASMMTPELHRRGPTSDRLNLIDYPEWISCGRGVGGRDDLVQVDEERRRAGATAKGGRIHLGRLRKGRKYLPIIRVFVTDTEDGVRGFSSLGAAK